ncbi:MAG: hypothetical protein VX471_05465 [Acidobacteriota bacterium]|nr:hypothetical protein [Acidobacteriota bacterium]
MPGNSSCPHVSAVHPAWAVAGGRITVEGRGFDLDAVGGVYFEPSP